MRNVVRATASTQSGTFNRIEPAPRAKPTLAEPLTQEYPPAPPPRREATPRLPGPPPSCDGFFSCGIETLLGLHDHDFEDQQEYERQERNRLMNQGSFTDKSGCEACAPQAAPNLYQTSGTGTELRPD